MKETKETLKTRILDGTIALFIEKGIERVTTRELTERLGISRSHIYYYFSNWQTLCIEALARYMQSDLEEFAAELVGMTPPEKLSALVDNYLPDAPDTVWQLYDSLWQMATHNAAYAELAESLTHKWDAFIAGIIDEGVEQGFFRAVNTARATRQLGSMLSGYADTLIITPSPEKCKEAAEDIADFISLIL
ncbi:TetR/AcrR family transcriptional regulator [Yersinia bercovieri]|uniref:TetR/AcrR family transcriptional regulator n=1 Tax=Yersinia bercovieri TaxID=634 RepID=UPI0011A127F6|nr:TetR/AcrR family transcriptional regulator [Yersinia bercovieri]